MKEKREASTDVVSRVLVRASVEFFIYPTFACSHARFVLFPASSLILMNHACFLTLPRTRGPYELSTLVQYHHATLTYLILFLQTALSLSPLFFFSHSISFPDFYLF